MARVLVVDDDPDTVRIVTFRLKERGHQVLGVTSPAEALEAVANRGKPDIAVLDVTMPDLDGFELLTKLRSIAGMDSLPAIFLSSRVLPEDIQAGSDVGATYLTKPFIASALLNKIDEALNSSAEVSW